MIAEKDLEHKLLDMLSQNGWIVKNASEIVRESYSEPLLLDNLELAIKRLNTGIINEDVTRVINQLKLQNSDFEGCKQILEYLKNGYSLYDAKEKNLRRVNLINYDDIYLPQEKRINEYLAVNQMIYVSGNKKIRTDIILYINGIPIVNIELKDPESLHKSYMDAYNDIVDYENKIKELYKYIQIGIVGDVKFYYFATVPWEPENQKLYEWKEIEDNWQNICSFLKPEKIINLLKYYIFIRKEGNFKTKIIARYMQYRAAEKIVDRVIKGLKNENEKQKGLIWHWQGSGKTLTMIFAANKIYQLPEASNPTIFFILDREELEDQLFKECVNLDIFKKVELVSSIRELKEIISHSNYSGKRGIFVTLIHKFKPEEMAMINKYFDEMENEIKNTKQTENLIINRKNIISFIDEAHRTQYGILASQMNKILKNGFKFGFTGTPISKKYKDTYQEFSYPDEKYLDRYFMEESTKDGFTLPLSYEARLIKEVHLKSEEIKIFYESEEDEATEELKRIIEKKMSERISKKEVFFENPERIKIIAQDLAKHFKDNLDGRYKALVVASSRVACTLYYKELLNYFNPDEIEIIMTAGPKEKEKEIENYYYRIKEQYGLELNEAKQKIIENFKEKENPKILIVVDMLITGFDAPVLQVIYLDKLLKDYRLLQAIARTNRPYKEKVSGHIVDYIGVLTDINKALLYYLEEGEETGKIIYKLEEVKEKFNELLDELLNFIEEAKIKIGDKSDQTMIKIIKFLLKNEERLNGFMENYKKLIRYFEFLGGDILKVENLEKIKWLSYIYVYYKKNYEIKDITDFYVQRYLKRTLNEIYKQIEFKDFIKGKEIYFDPDKIKNYIKNLDDKDTIVANIVFALKKYVLVDISEKQVFVDLANKIKELIKKWQEENYDYVKLIEEGVEIFKEKEKIENEQKELNIPDDEYVMYRILIKNGLNKELALKSVKEIKDEIVKTGEYLLNNLDKIEVQRTISQIIRRCLRRNRLGFTPMQLDNINNDILNDMQVEYGKKNKNR